MATSRRRHVAIPIWVHSESRSGLMIVVCGTRDWPSHLAGLVTHFISCLPKDTTVVTGGATGVDTIAHEAVQARGLETAVRPVTREDWDRMGKTAGPIRNAQMVAMRPDLVVAFRLPGRSPGTDDMVEQAQRAGIPTLVYRIKG